MDTDERALRARSFGAVAEDYDRYRPGPPADAVAWLLPPDCGSVVDIGAGTGALTRLLVGRVPEVIAVEPDARMAAVLTDRVPGADVREGRAEALPVPDTSVDAVLGSSMWHWVDEASAAGEAARVLRPGGVLGILWSGPDRSQEWVGELMAQGRPDRGNREQDERAPRRRHEVHLPAGAPFGPPRKELFEWTRTVTIDELAGLAQTFSVVIRLPDAERATLTEQLYDYVASHPTLADRDEVELPMRCFCWRAERL